MSGVRQILATVSCVGVLGLGYGVWSMISPDEQRRKELLKNLPESNPVRMEDARKRNALIMQVIREAAETNENVARSLGGPSK